MANKEKEYLRIPGRGVRRDRFFAVAATRSMLWLAKDHLLCVDNDRFSENYKRFYYNDIQAITTRRTFRWEIWNIYWGILAVVTAGVAHALADHIVLWSIVGVLCLSLLINLLRGPTCVCHLHTSVHTEELPSLSRMKIVLKARKLLDPLIKQAQGEIALPGIQDRAAEIAKKIADGLSSKVSRLGSSQTYRGYQGGAHKVLFSLMLLTGLVNSILFYDSQTGITLLHVAMGVGLFISVVVAIVRQYESDMRGGVRKLTWATLGYLTIFYFIGMIHYMLLAAAYADVVSSQWELMRIYSATAAKGSPFFLGLRMVFILCSFSIAIPGLVLLIKSPRALEE